MQRIKLLLILITVVSSLSAQDIHFSQFYLSPLNLNPAMTGVMNCNKRIVGNYRNQWASVLRDKAYSTYSASYDQRIPVGRYDNFGVGATLWGDKAGSIDFATLQARLSFSYSKKMGGYRKKAHYLVVGADVGVTQRSIDALKAQWGTQNNGGTFDNTLPSQETNLTNDYLIYPDVSAGVLWFSVFDDNQNLYFGAAYHHINRANQSFQKNGFEALYSRFTIHGGGEFLLTDRLGLVPGLLVYLQGPSMETNLGTSFKFLLGNSRTLQQALQFGLWTRIAYKLDQGIHDDAIILSTRFDYQQFSLGFSYDANISSLSKASNSFGGFEFALVYKMCGPEKRHVYCPNF